MTNALLCINTQQLQCCLKKYSLAHAGCMDQARGKFIKAQDAQPKGKKVKVSNTKLIK